LQQTFITKGTSSEGIKQSINQWKILKDPTNPLWLQLCLIFVTAIFLVITAPPDEGTSIFREEGSA